MAASLERSRIIIQSDWEEGLRVNNGTAWLTFKQPGASSIYGEIKTKDHQANGLPKLETSDGFSVSEITTKTIDVSYESGPKKCSCKFVSPLINFHSVHQKQKSVISLDVTPGGLAVSSDMDGECRVWTTGNGEVRRDLTGHYGDVYTTQFFPSGVVILTGGADMQVKIWSAESGKCVATLIGHKGAVLGTAIVGRGRNIISCSRDGTVKLWDVGEQKCLHTFDEMYGSSVNCVALSDVSGQKNLPETTTETSEREILTEGKLMAAGCENGSFQCFALQARSRLFSLQMCSPVNCCNFISPTLLACGTHDGKYYIYDIRNSSRMLHECKELRGAFKSILPYKQGMFATTGDGSCFYVSEDFNTHLELTGPDCDPVYNVVTDGHNIYTSCRDGIIRKYKAI